jgi:hypothetical protein
MNYIKLVCFDVGLTIIRRRKKKVDINNKTKQSLKTKDFFRKEKQLIKNGNLSTHIASVHLLQIMENYQRV